MGIFTRFMDIVNSNINALLDKAEDPEKMLKLMIQEMEDTIIELKTSCSAKMAEEIKIAKKYTEAQQCINRWQKRAEMAVECGKENLAREALIEKRKAMETLTAIEENLNTIKQSVKEGKEEISTLEDKLNQTKIKLKTLQEKQKEYHHYSDKGIKERFDEMEERINQMNAWNDLNTEDMSAEAKFAKMEKDSEIEKELEALKEAMK